MFFAIVNLMEDESCVEEKFMRLDKAKDCFIQKYLETYSIRKIGAQFKTRSQKRIAILPNTVHSYSTTQCPPFALRQGNV